MKPIFDILFDCEFHAETHIPTRHSEAVSSFSSRYVVSESIGSRYVSFDSYLYDENGEVNGVRLICDDGENYYYEKRKHTIDAYPWKEYVFYHSTTGVDDDGCPEDNSIRVQFVIIPHEESSDKE